MSDDSHPATTEVERRSAIVLRLKPKLDGALDALRDAASFARSNYQNDVFQIAETLMESREGMELLADRAARFEECGLFTAGPWEHAERLLAPLVGPGLRGTGVYPIVEILSELRMLAIAQGRLEHETVSADEARSFLDEVLALNLEFLFPGETEQERIEGGPRRELAIRLFELLGDALDLSELRGVVIEEIEQLSAQRPIQTRTLHRLVDLARRIPVDGASPGERATLDAYLRAVHGASPLSREAKSLGDYRARLGKIDPDALEEEARTFAEAMRRTGLSSPLHAILLRHLRARSPDLLPEALGLNDVGRAELAQQKELVHRLLRVSILPSTSWSILGFARCLERGVFSRREVEGGLTRLVTLDLRSEVRRHLLAQRSERDGASANSILVAGAIAVLGQPLGIGQGRNPTCQAARALSLWSQYAPGDLLELLVNAARDGLVEFSFEGDTIRSDALSGLRTERDLDLDPVSIVLVPHLDAVYLEMMRRLALRHEDAHKWANPELYGRWVPSGFASVFADVAQTTVGSYEDFVRRFYATHDPSYNEGHPLMYPNPVGICVTNGHGAYLRPHAVTIQRIDVDPSGALRVYFYNPNNEGRQDWGHGVKPTVKGNGEVEGESSLPFAQFASRLYAFHYNPYEEGDAYAVPAAVVDEVTEAARGSWGQNFTWVD